MFEKHRENEIKKVFTYLVSKMEFKEKVMALLPGGRNQIMAHSDFFTLPKLLFLKYGIQNSKLRVCGPQGSSL